jgi:hypothetical protein
LVRSAASSRRAGDTSAIPWGAESAAPAVPAGASLTCVLSMTDTRESPVCPVVRWGRWAYWVFTDTTTGYGFVVTPYDPSGAIATQGTWPKTVGNTRYVWQIGVDTAAMTVTFLGQSMTPVMMTWDELRIDQP